MTNMLCCGLAALVSAAALNAAPAVAASGYDGQWSVSVVTEQGDCDAQSLDLGIADGRIEERGLLSQASGAVDPRGAVQVVFTRGSDQLAATGILTNLDGSGRWTSPTRQCSGRWKAQKRS
ncbi:MAG: hypothetical protein JWN07_2132 [Hyphomicrobiales bacterium]|nr:hypothetical protein [Hyphomicrobiales bacterium]